MALSTFQYRPSVIFPRKKRVAIGSKTRRFEIFFQQQQIESRYSGFSSYERNLQLIRI
ncbi:hypothetical protein LEP1GSC039_0623 [Leptospira santarosai str. 2000027870]|nr:hypothetical protein LEP1GSC039_0623 [Leptospira santarosai str. 2000027870]